MPCALVLSAGGMYAAYQAGAWKALAPTLQPDLIVGASAGALNGFAIAGGCSPDELIARWTDPTTRHLMRFRIPPLTIFDPAPLARRIHQDFARYQPRLPFALTLVEVPHLRRVCVSGARITPAHLMASCAIPFGYPPVRIDGKFYVDGGLLDAVPIWAAVELGATRMVVINALPAMPSALLRFGVNVVRAIGPARPRYPNLDVLEIHPPGPLGPVHSAISWEESNIRRWIRQGESDAAKALAALPGGWASARAEL